MKIIQNISQHLVLYVTSYLQFYVISLIVIWLFRIMSIPTMFCLFCVLTSEMVGRLTSGVYTITVTTSTYHSRRCGRLSVIVIWRRQENDICILFYFLGYLWYTVVLLHIVHVFTQTGQWSSSILGYHLDTMVHLL